MSTAISFDGILRRRSPIAGAFFAPSHLIDAALVQTLVSISRDLVSGYSSAVAALPFQRKNARSLVLKVKILSSLFEFLEDSPNSNSIPSSATVCLKELYILIFRSRLLLDYISQCGKMWLLLQNPQISGHFHDLNQEIATILDVLPLEQLNLAADLREQLQLLQRQARRSKLYVDTEDELLRLRIFSFLDEFESGRAPDRGNLESTFLDGLRIRNAQTCRAEIDFLEEQIFKNEDDATDLSILGAVVALTRYCRFLLFGFAEDSDFSSNSCRRMKKRTSSGDISVTIPKDLCCPISLDVMRDPVIVSTGQTYDRASIVQWVNEGHNTCPNSRQMLEHTRLVPNKALRSLILQWCAAHGIHYEQPEGSEVSAENMAGASSCMAAVEANRATAKILVRKLDDGSEYEMTVAARELRMLAKTGKENRACIAEAGAIPLLQKLLNSLNPVAQENSVTALLNLSILDKNKIMIMEEDGCLRSIVDVLRHGRTTEARENAAATLFSLSILHDYKKRITDEPAAVEALAGLLIHGTQQGKKDAVAALFNLSTSSECCLSMMESGAVWALVQALGTGVSEEAAGALALLARQKIFAEVVGSDDKAVRSLVAVLRRGSPKAKENAIATLHELCKSGGVALTQRVAKTPALGGLIQTLLFTGTKRARRKAASLVRLCQRSEMAEVPNPIGDGHAGGWAMEYELTRSSSARQNSRFVGGDASISAAASAL